MLAIGTKFPAFRLQGVFSSDLNDAFQEVTNESFPDQWKVFFFYPKDFTFVCPTEILAFAELNQEFQQRNAQVLAASTDSEFVHLAWRKDKAEFSELPFPLLSDVSRELSEELGILEPKEKVCQRATFIVDPEGIIRFSAMYDPNVGRSPEEVLRVVDALQTGQLCPARWSPGKETIQID